MSRQPNILFIMTDQQRFGALSCHGGQAQTPVLDRLAAGGVDLQAFYTQAPVCVPSRCSLFSGRYPHSHGVRQNDRRLRADEQHLFKVLKAAGYRLGYVGKNHLLHEEEFGEFDFVDLMERRPRDGERTDYVQFVWQQYQKIHAHASWASATFHDFDPRLTDTYLSRASAVKFLQEVQAGRPFCLTVAFEDPHVPHLALAKYRDRYPLEEMRLPEAPEGVLDQKAPRYRIKQAAQGALKASEEDKRRYLAVQCAMVAWIDENVGAILDALDATGQRDDTIVVFTSDHGDFAFDYGMCKKDTVLLDCLLHVPAILSWPGHLTPRVVADTLVEQVDIVPTLLELCGLPAPKACDGRSFAPLFSGTCRTHKEAVFAEIGYPGDQLGYRTYEEFAAAWQQHHNDPAHRLHGTQVFNVPDDHCWSIRTPEWRYVLYEDGFEELYDVERDPRAWRNLALDGQHGETCNALRTRLDKWRAAAPAPRAETE